jgi:dolichyl-phosphate beta-glucosyltransferase
VTVKPNAEQSIAWRSAVEESTTSVVRLSLVIPAYNEAQRLESTLDQAWSFLTDTGEPFELIVIDDGSTDGTAAVARLFAQDHPATTIQTIPHAGKAAAVRAGMLSASGEFVAFTDADLATPLSYLDGFVKLAVKDADIVIGSREGAEARRIGEPWYRHLMGRVFNRMVQLLILPGIEDTQCGFKLFRREAAQAILQRALLYQNAETVSGPRVTAFDVELLVIARTLGLRVICVPVIWTYGTQSKVNPVRDTLYNARDILQVRLNRTFGRYRP